MKALVYFCLVLGLLFFGLVSYGYCAPWLACDKSSVDIKAVEVEVTSGGVTQVIPGVYVVEGNVAKVLDLAGRAVGSYRFRVRWHDGGGWWSDWSDPFDVSKSGKPGGVRVVP